MLSRRESDRPEETEQAVEKAGEEETQRLNADIPKSLHKRLRVQAAAEGRSQKQLIMEALKQYLKQNRE